jgi:hypothetical protein
MVAFFISSRVSSSPLIVVLLLVFFTGAAMATMPSNPVSDNQFLILPDGTNLKTIIVEGSPLRLSQGTGQTFNTRVETAYRKLKTATQTSTHHPVQWLLMDLESHQVIDQSADPHKKFFGASVSKIFVAATLLDQQKGILQPSQLQLMSEMLAVSSNTAWVALQNEIGHGDDDKGREANYNFTQRMGYAQTRGFQGTWGSMHGNELNAHDLIDFLYDTYHGHYDGAETLWKLMHTCRTGAKRARTFIPQNIYVGAKTGTYDGPSVDPETGAPIKMHVRHHVVIFNVGDHEYGLAILSNDGSDTSAALLTGGLLREYTSAKTSLWTAGQQ